MRELVAHKTDDSVMIAGQIGAFRFEVHYDRATGRVTGGSVSEEAAPRVASNCGDRFKASLQSRLGGIPCGECETERKRMNSLTVAQCVSERDKIIEDTLTRAKKSARWWDRVRAKLGDAIMPETARAVIGDCFDAAMAEALDAPTANDRVAGDDADKQHK